MSNENNDYDQWLKDSEEFFQKVKSYNSTIITIGYATFFAILLYISGKVSSPLILWALISLVLSAAIFICFELFANIQLALAASAAGKMEKRFFRFWAAFFIPSAILGVIGVLILLALLLSHVAA